MESPCCDSCLEPLAWRDGYLLTTATVAISVPFWESQFRRAKPVIDLLDERQRANGFNGYLARVAGRATPWLLCADCVAMFPIDRGEARSSAERRADPPRTGPVDPVGCAPFAAIAWEVVFGRWPASVRQPKAVDTCDFCGRTIYQREYCASIPTEDQHVRFFTEHEEYAPLRPARPDQDGWLACIGCANRQVVARTAEDGR